MIKNDAGHEHIHNDINKYFNKTNVQQIARRTQVIVL